MYKLIRKFLFLFPAEVAHDLSLPALSLLDKVGLLRAVTPNVETKSIKVMGIEFPNRVGLAAGLDKNGDYISALSNLGFGFVEIGTVTPLAQPGNDKPRIFRLPEANAIINRMGFNNDGIDQLIENVNKARGNGFKGVLGINIGKNLKTKVEDATKDYLIGLRQAYYYADYITINISSPNTPGLRTLQYGDELNGLLSAIKNEQMKLALEHKKYVPVAIKVAPDLTEKEVEAVAESILANNMDALIATNTTLARDTVEGLNHANEAGGLSGDPVKTQSTKIIAEFHKYLKGQVPIIGVGGISSAKDAEDKLNAGASLVQIYTGFIYQGPGLISDILQSDAINNHQDTVIDVDVADGIDDHQE
ncbi:quinone-dependent dihydroorotate dehydrogenase [Cocleimonas sp. KMM 6892]|uniref:quinone-dependent dihydroorotate dehydrogenase n=1 Tax=unclassified Cocleimonas TaxID=2639732 RepID=UPI002DB9016E|nr:MULTISPECIES: quinone-dependent dihydroorotate dehydrogenase [unclassified Cocleimonas]MEB8432289.1 quinone-dependent dihydroorotate dehydrogenase [Cocleimonas sp. KMM 6892]MEC4714625.1 quinone-dependent dihydroorotate dehydrogenase [Cocleimonas sp. KMM 6895]MEC4744561.1 quinone-dependent dihydroorotate dehydrogenase [Cocleimonas sp. KMM 6896]